MTTWGAPYKLHDQIGGVLLFICLFKYIYLYETLFNAVIKVCVGVSVDKLHLHGV